MAPVALPPLDACRLVATAEVAKVQEVEVLEARSSERVRDQLAISSCFYRAADYSRSASVEIARPDPASAGSRSVAARWQALFPQEAAGPAREEKRGRFAPAGEESESEAEAEQPTPDGESRGEAQPVSGLGEQAYWIGTARYGALYVLADDAFLRVSVGGPGELPAKLERARALAAHALAGLAGRTGPPAAP